MLDALADPPVPERERGKTQLKNNPGNKRRGKGLEAVSRALLPWRELQAKHGIIAFGAWSPERLDKARTVARALHTFAGLRSQDKES